MPSFDTNAAISTTLEKSKELASTLFKKFVNQAVGDTQDFLRRSKDGVARAGLLFAEGKIDRDDFEDLILGKKGPRGDACVETDRPRQCNDRHLHQWRPPDPRRCRLRRGQDLTVTSMPLEAASPAPSHP